MVAAAVEGKQWRQAAVQVVALVVGDVVGDVRNSAKANNPQQQILKDKSLINVVFCFSRLVIEGFVVVFMFP